MNALNGFPFASSRSGDRLDPTAVNILQQIIELGTETHDATAVASVVAMAPGTVTVVKQVGPSTHWHCRLARPPSPRRRLSVSGLCLARGGIWNGISVVSCIFLFSRHRSRDCICSGSVCVGEVCYRGKCIVHFKKFWKLYSFPFKERSPWVKRA